MSHKFTEQEIDHICWMIGYIERQNVHYGKSKKAFDELHRQVKCKLIWMLEEQKNPAISDGVSSTSTHGG